MATVTVSHDGQASTPPTRVTATFTAKVTSILPGLITVSGSCTNPPAPTTALDATGRVLTVTLGNFQCDSGQTLTVSVDPTKVQLENATLADTSVWTRTFTMAMLPQLISGNISGLAGRLLLQNNGGETLASLGDGSFFFPTPVAYGAPYAVTVNTQPQGQTCSVNNGSGTVGSVAIRNVAVVCSTNIYQVAGSVSGLVGNITLQLNGSASRTLSTNGAFSFPTSLAQGSAYAVTVQTQPAGQTCSVSNGTGTVNGPVSNVQVVCSANSYTVGGTVSGLTGSVALQNNGADNLTMSSNGAFTFSTPVATGATYNVTVLTQPAAQTCTVTNGSGSIGGANVTSAGVACSSNTTTISVSGSPLTVPVGGGPVYLTVTNTGGIPANMVIPHNTGNIPLGWSSPAACGLLAPQASCNIMFFASLPFVATAQMSIQGNNTNAVNIKVASSSSGHLVYDVKSINAAMVAAPTVASDWHSMPSLVNATSRTDGRANTDAITQSQFGVFTAARRCRDLGTQWYLPAVCELGSTYCQQQPNIVQNLYEKGFFNGGMSWSSTEVDSQYALAVYTGFPGGLEEDTDKRYVNSLMCVAEHPY
ncbi:hypothetical protein [Paracidovorax wautersii]|uniref:hypothetical protein n=1 Tax=Paracidovorax wautersii TaxID=1177982 RepID=UPI00286B8F66|nr:hypothetical protein [Paracidovorax wautersii]